MNPNFNRRQFIGLAVCVAVNTALPGCKKKEPEWTAAKDDKLKPLAFEISLCRREYIAENGNVSIVCDNELKLRLEAKLMAKILLFDIRERGHIKRNT